MELNQSRKWLFVLSASLAIAAFAVKYIHFSKQMTQVVGIIEIFLAAIIGIAFGILATKKA
jgi:hypothetical protein